MNETYVIVSTKGEVREKLEQGWYCTKANLTWRKPE